MSPGPGRADTGAVLRFAARVVADPGTAVGRWRALSGGKAAGCLPPIPVPEILHAAELLPVALSGPQMAASIRSRLDAWVVSPEFGSSPGVIEGKPCFVFPATPFHALPDALDLVESLAEWAGTVSGRPVREGALWRSIRAYRERDILLRLLQDRGTGPGLDAPAREEGDLARAGDFLPPETHAALLGRAAGDRRPGIAAPDEEKADPLLRLAGRLIAPPGR